MLKRRSLVPLLIALAAWCLPRPSSAAITVDTANISSATAPAAATLSWSHTVGAGASRILIVGTSHRTGTPTVSGVTYGVASLTLIGTVSAPGSQNTSTLWYLLAPPQGTANVVVTLSGNAAIVGGAVTLFGVDPVTPLGTYASNSGSSTTASVTATSAPGELVIDTVAANGTAATLTPDASQTTLWNTGTGIAVGDVRGGGSTKAGAASVLMSWTLGANRAWAIGAVPLRPVPLSGRVFEDVNYGGGAGRDLATASGVPRSGARVELYGGAGSFVSFTTTDTWGGYSFSGIAAGNYTVRVVNSTVTSSRGAGAVVPVQTYRTTATTGTALPVTNYVGGQNPAVADAGNGSAGTTMNTTTGVFTGGITGTAQSIANASVGAAGVSGVDFGFNFDTVVNVNNLGQGSLRQYILNSNALGGEAALAQSGFRMNLLGVLEALPAGLETSIFMISDGAAHPGLRAADGQIASQLTGGVAVITPTSVLPNITGPATSVDGTTQTANVGNTNAAVLTPGGTVGVDGLTLSTVAAPEVEIGSAASGALATGLAIQGANAVVRGLAIHGFGTANPGAGVSVNGGSNALIEGNVLGSSATSFTDPGAAQRNQGGVYGTNSSNSTVRNNLIGFGRVTGIYLDTTTATGWTISGNEIRDSGMTTGDGDGITISAATNTTMTGSLITGSSSQGLVLTAAGAAGNVFRNNTVTGNGVGIASSLVQSPGIAVRASVGAAANVLDRNVIRANYGAGVQVNSGATGTRITRNSFSLNGTITARNNAGPTGQIGIDLNTPGPPADDPDFGTAPFRTLNDLNDTDTGGNDLLNFPLLGSATLYGGNLVLRGYARPGSVIELFTASSPADPTGFGEGETWRITLTESGIGAGGDDPVADTDSSAGPYGGTINGIAQGTDNTNRFMFTFLAGSIGVGTRLTATATFGGKTSEFSGNVTVINATLVELMSFEAASGDHSVTLIWQTASELDNLGFHLHRATAPEGPYQRITPELIPGLGWSPVGASYSYVDAGLVAGQRYYYRLEDIDTRSVSTFHGPASAVAGPLPPGGGDTDGGDTGGGGAGGGSSKTCPRWVLSMHGESGFDSLVCTRHGNPDAVSLSVLSRTLRSAEVELRTGGFWTVEGPEGSVRAYAKGFDTPAEAKDLALPVRRTLVEAVVGRRARLVSAEGFNLRSFAGLRPAAVGVSEMAVSPDGTVRPVRREERTARPSRGWTPADLARLTGTLFQGERKSAVLEVTPLRYDGSRGELVLAKRVRVRLAFEGVEPGEKGSGSQGRLQRGGMRIVREVLAQLYTTRRGLHGLRFEEVCPAQEQGLATSRLRLQREGEAVAFHVEPTPSVFEPGSVLFFEADRLAKSTDFTREVAYELVWSRDGAVMEVINGAPEGVPLLRTSVGSATYEVNRLYQSGLVGAADVWLWEAMPSGASRTKEFTLEGLDTASVGNGGLVVELQGGSESGTALDHHVQVLVNGTYGGETWFAGKVPHALKVEVPASLLQEGANEVQVLNVGDTGVSSLVFLDRFGVSYPQVLQLRSGVFEGTFGESGTAEVQGLVEPAVVVDVTEASGSGAKWLAGVEVAGNALRFRVEGGRRYEVVSGAGLMSPRVVRPEPSTLRSVQNQADYVLVTPASFLTAAEPLLTRRASEGLTVKAVTLEEIATVFGHGTPSGEAIRSFVSCAYHTWSKPSLRYVVLLGDATYDPQHFVATSWASPLPALWGRTSFLWTSKDPVLGAVNGEDEIPDVAVGRIPATTVEQAEALVGKLLAWEDSGQGLSGKAALVADNPDVAGDFEWDVEDIRASFLGDRETAVLKVGQLGSGTRPAIQAAFDGGLSLMSYVGHGAAAIWASENVWNSWDAARLLAQTSQPLLLTLNCLNGYFVATNFDSLSESLLKVEGRGAVAALSPSGLSQDGPAHQYHRAVVQELVSGQHERLGDAILAAERTYAETGLTPELLSIYHLFGDPAMRIR